MASLYDTCPACSSPFAATVNHPALEGVRIAGARQCLRCGGLYGVVGLADSRALVQNAWHTAEDGSADDVAYYDFITMPGGDRRHGWFDLYSRKIVQSG